MDNEDDLLKSKIKDSRLTSSILSNLFHLSNEEKSNLQSMVDDDINNFIEKKQLITKHRKNIKMKLDSIIDDSNSVSNFLNDLDKVGNNEIE